MRLWLGALITTMATSGCYTAANLHTGYQYERTTMRPRLVQGGLAVSRLVDARPPRVYSTAGRGFMTYVPLLPYVTIPFERVDESAQITAKDENLSTPAYEEYTYPASMAKAIAEDLGASGIFDRVEYIGSDSTSSSRYALSGTIRSSALDQYATSYGLGIVGVYLWFLPIPFGKQIVQVDIDLVLTDTTSSEVLWRDTLHSEISKIFSLYTAGPGLTYGGPESFGFLPIPSDALVDRTSLFGWHFEALRRAMKEAKPKLVASLQAR